MNTKNIAWRGVAILLALLFVQRVRLAGFSARRLGRIVPARWLDAATMALPVAPGPLREPVLTRAPVLGALSFHGFGNPTRHALDRLRQGRVGRVPPAAASGPVERGRE